MKILAIEKEVENADWKNLGDLLREEAHHVFNLFYRKQKCCISNGNGR